MLASTPERAASTPIFTGPDCANDGTLVNELAASALADCFRKSLRFLTDIVSLQCHSPVATRRPAERPIDRARPSPARSLPTARGARHRACAAVGAARRRNA